MEILTITSSKDKGTVEFDERVNKALEEGYILVERDMIPGGSFGSKTYQPAYYAELVRTDEQLHGGRVFLWRPSGRCAECYVPANGHGSGPGQSP